MKYDRKSTKAISNEIAEVGHRVFESLGKESVLKDKRKESLGFINKLSQNYSGGDEHTYIKDCVVKLINQQKESIDEMEKYVKSLTDDERSLEEKIKRKNIEISITAKRLKGFSDLKPAFMDEIERLEKDLEHLYTVYLDKFRNLDYLENLVDKYNDIEYQKQEAERRRLSTIQKKIQDDEDKMIGLNNVTLLKLTTERWYEGTRKTRR